MRPLLIVLLVVVVAACTREQNRPDDGPIVIISIDTLRSDRLPAYGYGQGSTPAIDRLRADSILFKRAFSHCPLTLPSHASLFTGLLPPGHGVRDNAGYSLPPTARTLAELLSEHGYSTGGAVSSYILRRSTGIDQGFEFFDETMVATATSRGRDEERDGEKTRVALTSWLDSRRDGRFFAFLHLFEPHSPYLPPAPYSQSANPYDGEVSYADAIVGRFLDDLKRRGLYENAVIVLLSDHGEGLGDHGEDEHGVFLYRESIQVPLLIKLPGQRRAGEVVEAPVGLVDVTPALLSLARIPVTEPFDGANLLEESPGRRLYAETYFPRLHLGWSEMFSLIDSAYHYIAAPRAELYRYDLDPAEKSNQIATDRRTAAAFRLELQQIDRRFNAPASVDPEEQEKLAALGYLGSGGGDRDTYPDPKDRISYLRELKRAYAAYERGEYQRAAALLQTITRTNPDMIDGWSLLAQSYRYLGRNRDALGAIDIALTKFPANPDLALLAAEIHLAMRRFEEAEEHAKLALPRSEIGAHEMLGKIALAKGQDAAAVSHFDEALRLAPQRTSSLLLMAQAMKRQRRFAEELEFLNRVATTSPIPDFHYERGVALLELGHLAEAEQALRQETSLFPSNLEAWGTLAIVLGAQKRFSEARAVLADAQRRNPGPKALKFINETLQVLDSSSRRSP